MIPNGKSFALLALCLTTAACADRLALDVRCTPRGAEILVGGKVVGTCPATVRYEIGEEDKKRGTLQVKEMTVRWLSGASVTRSSVSVTSDIPRFFRCTPNPRSNSPASLKLYTTLL